MRIVNGPGRCFPKKLRNVPHGSCVQFESTFHQKHAHDDVFIVGDRTYSECNKPDNIFVVNLRTGCVSYVNGCRHVRVVEAHVCVDG